MNRYSSVVLLANMAAPLALALVGGRSSAIIRSVARSNSRLPRRGGYATAVSNSRGDAPTSNLILPELCVFDLDMCLWSPEMYELSQVWRPLIDSYIDLGGYSLTWRIHYGWDGRVRRGSECQVSVRLRTYFFIVLMLSGADESRRYYGAIRRCRGL